jgi:hypothetical protein
MYLILISHQREIEMSIKRRLEDIIMVKVGGNILKMF